jgi:hypothetical protein
VYLTEETMEINDRFSPIFQTLEFGTDNKAIIVDMMAMVAVMEYNKTKVSSSENSFKICTCKMNIESETL